MSALTQDASFQLHDVEEEGNVFDDPNYRRILGVTGSKHYDRIKRYDASAEPTGAMVALLPSDADAARLAVPGGEPADELHLTLWYLGDADRISPEDQEGLVNAIESMVERRALPQIQARVFGANLWNPDSDNPAVVLAVGDLPEGERPEDQETLAAFRSMVEDAWHDGGVELDVPSQHSPWQPHICAIYTGNAAEVARLTDRVGPVTFDRVRVAFAGENHDIPLHPIGEESGTKRYNPHQPRVPGGEHGGQWIDTTPGDGGGKNPLDKLRLAGRIPLDDGESLVRSDVFSTKNSGAVPMALTRGPDGSHELRIGMGIADEDKKSWAGRDLGQTAILDEDGVRKFRSALDEMHAVGVDATKRMERVEARDIELDQRRRDILKRQYRNLSKDEARRLDEVDREIERLDNEIAHEEDGLRRSAQWLADNDPKGRARWDEIEAEIEALDPDDEAEARYIEKLQVEQARLVPSYPIRRIQGLPQLREDREDWQAERDELTANPSPLTAQDEADLAVVDAEISANRAEHESLAEKVIFEGTIPGDFWADLVYSVETKEGAGIYDGDWISYTVGARPHDADKDWELSEDHGATSFEPKELAKLAKMLDDLTGSGSKSSRSSAGLKHPGHPDQDVHSHRHGGIDLIPPMAGLKVLDAEEYERSYGNVLDEQVVSSSDGIDLSVRVFKAGNAHLVLDLPGDRYQVMSEMDGAQELRELAAEISSKGAGILRLQPNEAVQDEYLELDEGEAGNLGAALEELAESLDEKGGVSRPVASKSFQSQLAEVIQELRMVRARLSGALRNELARIISELEHLPGAKHGNHDQRSHGRRRTGILGSVMDDLESLREKLSDDDRSVLDRAMEKLRNLESSDVDDDDLVEDEAEDDDDPDDDEDEEGDSPTMESDVGELSFVHYTDGNVDIDWEDGDRSLRLSPTSQREVADAVEKFNTLPAVESPEMPDFEPPDSITTREEFIEWRKAQLNNWYESSAWDSYNQIVGDMVTSDGKLRVTRSGGGTTAIGDPETLGDNDSPGWDDVIQVSGEEQHDEFVDLLRQAMAIATPEPSPAGKSASRGAPMATKSFHPTFKNVSDRGEVTFVVATLNEVDKDGDVTLPGFFGKQHVTMVPVHDWNHVPIGKGLIYESGSEVLCDAKLNLKIPAAKDWYEAIKFDFDNPPALQQFSYGFDVLEGGQKSGHHNGRSVRYLQPKDNGQPGVKVHEVSPVLVGAGSNTRTLAVKGHNGMRIHRSADNSASTVTRAVKGAIGAHETKTVSRPWDCVKTVKSLPDDSLPSELRTVYGWVDPDGDPEDRAEYKMAHHHGIGGPASVRACLIGITQLNDGNADIPGPDRKGVYEHLAAHLKDAGHEPPALRTDAGVAAATKNMRFGDEAVHVLASVSALIDRATDVMALRATKGKAMATGTADLLSWVADDLTRLKSLLSQPVDLGPEQASPSEPTGEEIAALVAASIARINGF